MTTISSFTKEDYWRILLWPISAGGIFTIGLALYGHITNNWPPMDYLWNIATIAFYACCMAISKKKVQDKCIFYLLIFAAGPIFVGTALIAREGFGLTGLIALVALSGIILSFTIGARTEIFTSLLGVTIYSSLIWGPATGVLIFLTGVLGIIVGFIWDVIDKKIGEKRLSRY